MPLKAAQQGLVLTVTSQDCIIHWPNTTFEANSTQLINSTEILPYQEGNSIEQTEINNSDSSMDHQTINAQEVLMIRQPQSPLNPPRRPDYRSSDESEADIPPNSVEAEGKTKN